MLYLNITDQKQQIDHYDLPGEEISTDISGRVEFKKTDQGQIPSIESIRSE